jgi:hypothetical protein
MDDQPKCPICQRESCPGNHCEVHFYAARVLVDEIEQHVINLDEPTVVNLVRRVRIITVNGQIFTQVFSAFSNFSEDVIVADWDRTWKTDWFRISAEKESVQPTKPS